MLDFLTTYCSKRTPSFSQNGRDMCDMVEYVMLIVDCRKFFETSEVCKKNLGLTLFCSFRRNLEVETFGVDKFGSFLAIANLLECTRFPYYIANAVPT